MISAAECDCILLAAGLSSRMKRSKMLREIDGQPLIRIALANALAACRTVILVVGHEADAVRTAAGNPCASAARGRDRLLVVENPAYRDGMVGSIQAGMRHVESEWFFVAPGDMPALRRELYEAVAREASENATGTVVTASAFVPHYGSTRGHPVLIHRSLIPRLLAEPGSAGPMRDLLARYPVRPVRIDDPAITIDVDTESDFDHFVGTEGGDPP